MNWFTPVIRAGYSRRAFRGRARRKEYWMFVLFQYIFFICAVILDGVFGFSWVETGFGPITISFSLFLIIPGFSLTIRRLHDTGKSGWKILIALIPGIGAIWFIILMVTDSDSIENIYGGNPKEIKKNTQ